MAEVIMEESKLQVFIGGVTHYFTQNDASNVVIGTPYLAENCSPAAFDFTGIIGIAGPTKGCVYFSAPRALLRHLLLSMGEMETTEDNMIDLVGEVANTISGNARREYGPEFLISVPVMMRGAPDAIFLPRKLRSYVIPVYWKAYNAAVVICLQ